MPTLAQRQQGTGEAITAGAPAYEPLRAHFPSYPGGRAIIRASLNRISDSCGYAVPRYDYVGERDQLVRWAETKGPDGLERYRADNNARSLDGLPGLELKR